MNLKMHYNKSYHRRSIRLKNYDYAQGGMYFITICAYDKKYLFGKIVNEKMILNDLGHIVLKEWLKTGEIRKNIKLDEFVIMPNHFHCILNIIGRGTACRALSDSHIEKFNKPVHNSIPTIIRSYKSAVTKQINQCFEGTARRAPTTVWQRNYYEHIIRNEHELKKIREYISNNPLKWKLDFENLNRIKQYKNFTEYIKEKL